MDRAYLTEKPIAFFDLETTGVDVVNDKIVQIAVVKISPDGDIEKKKMLINPGRPIPKEASDVHGILDEHVKDKPYFKQISKSLYLYLEGCDIGGYNSNQFDVPMLIEEFRRVGLHFDITERNFIDVMRIERVLHPGTLEAVYERYTGKTLDGAHDALADVVATYEVFLHQLNKVKALGLLESFDIESIDIYSQGESKRVDLAGKLCEIDNKICWTFGKGKGNPVRETPSFAAWFLKQSIPYQTAQIIIAELKK